MSKIYQATKTTLPTKTGYQRTWYVIDASKLPVGRLASKVASLLTGKNRANYTPSVDMGGCVVITHANKLIFTGKKMEKKVYFRHEDGRIGALKHRTMSQQMALDSTRPLYLAVKGMLPKNRHKDVWLNQRLHILKDDKHDFTQNLVEVV